MSAAPAFGVWAGPVGPLLALAASALVVDRLSCRGAYCPPEALAVRRVARSVVVVSVIAACACLSAAWLARW